MTTDSSSLRSRRAVLGAAAAAAAATAAAALVPRQTVEAANGDSLILGSSNLATSQTQLTANPGDNILSVLKVKASYGSAIQAENSDTISGQAVQAKGPNGGIQGMATGAGAPGVVGIGDPAVLGQGGIVGLATMVVAPSISPAGAGVYGESNAIGVHGVSGSSAGAVGQSTATGTGVQGYSHGSTRSAPPPAPPATGVEGIAPSPGRGVHGFSGAGTPPSAPAAPVGVYGQAAGVDPTGMWGDGGTASSGSTTGVYGEGDTGVWGFGGWGVFGASDATGTGVYGFSGATVPAAPAHVGVFAYSDSGYAVYARAATGTALYVDGKARFRRSGKTAVAASHSSVSVTLAGVTTSSWVIATPQTNRAGVFVQSVVAGSGKFTIYLNKAVSAATYVGWLVVN